MQKSFLENYEPKFSLNNRKYNRLLIFFELANLEIINI